MFIAEMKPLKRYINLCYLANYNIPNVATQLAS